MVIEDITRSKDGSCKYRFRTDEGLLFLAVRIPQEGDLKYCISCQVGCPNKCVYCLTGHMQFDRDLEAEEIVDQVKLIAAHSGDDLRDVHLLYMGMGEPLLNFRNTVSSAEMFLNKYNIREITLSTSGIFPKMRDLFAADLPIRIAVSVHATRPHVRERLMPVEKFFPIRDVLRECESYTSVNGHSLILEYLMLQGMNDSMEDFLDFIETTKNVSKEIHVIPFNESRFIPFRRSKKEVIKTFVDMLRAKGIRAYVKESYGQDVGAGCGQLFSEDAALIRFADAPERCGPPSS